MHPIERRFLVEDFVRVRPADEQRRYVASQRSGRIDPNPHQIAAVVFALNRIPEGGCILADEVGLGKTIEAGLVIAQLLAEGAERVLLITPKALLGQWRQELFTLFSITTTEYEPGVDLALPGVFLVTRDFAGGEKGDEVLRGVPPFDLCVIDEAHEIFAALYKRYDRSTGMYLSDSSKAKMAGRVRSLLLDTPVLLLTATPIQNTLTELWGLIQFVEPSGTLLGNLATFREMFCAGNDRQLAEGQEHELQKRLAEICKRTLRRQAQEFMIELLLVRGRELFEYAMSVPEKSLYDDVTEYLLEPGICAFRGNQRRLLLIGFHRRMASSVPALAASLEKVAARLEKMLSGAIDLDEEETASALLDDLEEDEREVEQDIDEGEFPSPETLQAEILRVQDFVDRARSLPSDSKAYALVRAVRTVLERAASGEGSGKIVVFTESLTTQEYLRQVLSESGQVSDEEITLFRGTNDGKRAKQALERWRAEELAHLPKTAHPTKDIAQRLALVHEFKTRSKVFISTEAGAKGLNLQFAGTLINYDLPWNPQRIEQRIGRIHRYGQTRDVLVINFVAKDNEAQKLLLEILMQKLDLFGTVLGASDEVLHKPSTDAPETLVGVLGSDFEAQLKSIYQRARSQDEIEAQLVALRESIGEQRARFENTHERTAGLIEDRFDDQVKQVFRRIQDALPQELVAFDRDLEQVVTVYLDAVGAQFEREVVETGVRLHVATCAALPEDLRDGFVAHLGDARGVDDVEPLHLGHPLVRAAIEDARRSSASPFMVYLTAPDGMTVGAKGRMKLVKIRYAGYQALETLIPVALLEGDPNPLELEQAQHLLHASPRDARGLEVNVDQADLDDAVEELLFVAEEAIAAREQERFSRTVDQIETFVEDRLLLLERQRQDALAQVAEAENTRDAAVGAEARTRAERRLKTREAKLEKVESELDRLQRRDDPDYARWIERANARRSRPPVVEELLDIRFRLVGADD